MAIAKKQALVVDDSRSARLVLQRMLEKHALEVMTAESAEQAIDYLSHYAPQVIFMDHMMPGMDGFQAIKAIKLNPDTATIPIVMYTAKSGEVYVGQARALGAFDVLSKSIHPQQLQQILHSLNLIPKDETAPSVESRTEKVVAMRDHQPSSRVQEDVTRLAEALSERIRIPDFAGDFAELRVAVRRDLKAQLQTQDNTLERHFNELRSELQRQFSALQINEKQHARQRWRMLGSGLLMGLLLAAPLYWLMQDDAKIQLADGAYSPQQVQQRIAALTAENRSLSEQLADTQIDTGFAATPEWLPVIEWLANRNTSLGYTEVPLDERQAVFFSELLKQLDNAGFEGSVEVEVHSGDFCLVRAANGELQLPGNALPVTQCERLELPPEQALEISARQSIDFTNFLNSSPLLAEGRIQLHLLPRGNQEPRHAYPAVNASVNALEWNRLASANSRLAIRLIPAETLSY